MADALTLSSDELALVGRLEQRLSLYGSKNRTARNFFAGVFDPKNYGITVPPQMRVEHSVGWCSKVVNTIEARLDFEGWASPSDSNPFGLQDIYNSNNLGVLSHQAHLDALIYGCSFVVVGKGAPGEPDPLITVESPLNMTAEYSLRTKRLTSALYHAKDDDEEVLTLYTPNETVYMARETGKPMQVINRVVHNLGRVPVVVLANGAHTERPFGHSEMTKSIRASTVEAVKTELNMSVNSEFYAAPQRYALGVEEAAFKNPDGTAKNPWTFAQSKFLALGSQTDQDGNPVGTPQVGEFSQSSPTPYISVLQYYARKVASDADLPVRLFDENKNAPTSADAIRADESALVKRCERKTAEFSLAWREVGLLALLVRGGAPAEYPAISPQWKSPATPTKAASTDAAVKLVATGIVPADSDVVLDAVDMSNIDKERIKLDRAAAASTPNGKEDAEALAAKFNALGTAIRAGVTPESAAKAVGLSDLQFLNNVYPVTLHDTEDGNSLPNTAQ